MMARKSSPDPDRDAIHDFAVEVLSLHQRGELTGYAAQRLLMRADSLNETLRSGPAGRGVSLLTMEKTSA